MFQPKWLPDYDRHWVNSSFIYFIKKMCWQARKHSSAGHPCAHIMIDFITGLPVSEGNTLIHTIREKFSKTAHFIPLSKLPTELETSQLLISHVFQYHGIPCDVASDRGPQFISQVWSSFCQALRATSSHTSGYHSQSNGQTERCN